MEAAEERHKKRFVNAVRGALREAVLDGNDFSSPTSHAHDR